MKLTETRIVVTGAASGMGRHFALALAQAGAGVAACDIDAEGLATLKTESAGLPGALHTFVADVSNEESVIGLMDEAWAALGSLNGLVNNAGIFRDALLVKQDQTTGELKTMSLKNWQRVIDIDLTGPFLCTRELAKRVIANQAGPAVVVNISSVSRHGNPGQSNYSAAKAGLVADTEVWGKELARHGIRVGAIAPGFIDTPILQGMRPEMLAQMTKAVPLRRVGTPDEIFAGIRFIIECDYFTARCIDIDGGLRL